MNKMQMPGWAASHKARSAHRRELQDEIMEALLNYDSPLGLHRDFCTDE